MIPFIILSASVILCAIFYGGNISFTTSLSILSGLITISSVVLAILGALLAICYPEKIRNTFRGDKFQKTQESDSSFSETIDPFMYSAALLILLVASTVIGPVIQSNYEEVNFAKHCFFVYVSILTLFQMIIIFQALLPLDTLKTKSSKIEASNRIRSNLYKKKPPVTHEID